jgi:hypothetical protein
MEQLKVIIFIACAGVTGCSTTQLPSLQSLVIPSLPIPTEVYTTAAWSQEQADMGNQILTGVIGPNNVSEGLLEFQNYNRDTSAVLQNPWIGISMLRNLWTN